MTGPSNDALQVFYGTLPLLGTILIAMWREGKRFDDLHKRIDDLSTSLNKRLDGLEARLSRVEDRLSDRLVHP